MANLRFSPGLLSSIRDFGSSLTQAPASQTSTLTGAGVQPASLGGMLARNVGNLMGRDMRTPQEKAQAELQGIDPKDPNAQIKSLEVVAKYGTPSQIADALGKIQTIQAGRQEAQRVENQRLALFELSANLGLEMGPEIQNAAPEELVEIAKELRNRQIELATRGDDDKAVEALAATAGITSTDLKAQYGDNPPSFEEMKTVVERGDKGAIKAYVPVAGGGAKMYSVLGNKVLIDGKWVRASDAGLAPAPQQVQTQELDGIFGKMPDDMKELVNETVSNTIKAGGEASDTLAENARAQQLIDDGIFSGLGANAKVEIARLGSFFGIDTPTLENTQAFALERAAKVADIIQAYGAGTGLSDADREFALAQAGTPTLEVETLQRMLRIEKQVAEFQLRQASRMTDEAVKAGLLTPEAVRLLDIGRGSVPMPQRTGPSQRSLQYIQ
tara:strand:+ start:358 stop:1686 length:1329 start_codon:yes stop_codon:yes gene_type:complete